LPKTNRFTFDRAARLEAVRWRQLRSLLRDPEWSPETAACVLVGVDPEDLNYSHAEGWFLAWLPGCPEYGAGGDVYSIERNFEMELERMRRLTSAADPVKVQTPEEWIRWSVTARCEPSWLLLAHRRRSVARLLPYMSTARKGTTSAAGKLHSQISAMGAHARHSGTPQAKAKVAVRHDYEEWIRKGRPGTATDFAHRTADKLRKRAEESKDPIKAAYAEESTIKTWVRVWSREG
jgi:hypothetical protein